MKPFKPSLLPLDHLSLVDYLDLLGPANRAVARYDGLMHALISPELLISPLRTKEAVLSSRIEGTRATYQDVATFDAKVKPAAADYPDLEEVLNYRSALLQAKGEMDRIPLTLNLIRTLHGTLMEGVRGHNSGRGQFRRVQNWIGGPGSTLETASHVPPSVPDMTEALYNWEKYLHGEELDIMIQLAVMHAQFEIIHPFLDGNGRIGRILIPLFLYHKKIIHAPYFYMSDYLEANRSAYYTGLQNITKKNDWVGWIRFFLTGVIEQAEKNVGQAKDTLALYEEMKVAVINATNSHYAIKALDFLFQHPVLSNSSFYEDADIPRKTASRILKDLAEAGVVELTIPGNTRKPSVYEFRPLLKIVNR